MNPIDPQVLEPDEMETGRPAQLEVTRRDFFKTLGSGVMVLFLVPAALGQEAGSAGRRGRGGQASAEISAWLHIGEDGRVTVFTGKTEVGQNIRTSLTQAVAEELRVAPSAIEMVMADTDLVPYDAGTFGSQTTPQMASRLHRVAATAREVLLDMAADYLKASRASLTVADGKIGKANADQNGAVTFGQLTKGQKFTKTVSDSTAIVTPAAKWTIAGTSVPKVDGRDFVTGRHKYSSDMKLPGMLFAKRLRPTSFGAQAVSVDTKAAEAMEGVKVVRDGDFIGVVAPDALQAEHAVNAIKVEWSAPGEQPSNASIFDYLRQNVVAGGGRGGRGDEAAPAAGGNGAAAPIADQTLKQTYTVAYIAHTPLEPRAAVADWKEDKLTVWTGTQRPFGVRTDLAQALGIPEERIRVIVPDTGSGYGGKHTGEAAIEAARFSRAAGKPVKMVWTRQEEFTWALFSSGRNHRHHERRAQRRHPRLLGSCQLPIRQSRSAQPLPYSSGESKDHFPPDARPIADRFLPRACLHRQSFRA